MLVHQMEIFMAGCNPATYHSGMYYAVPLKDWGQFIDRETDSCAVVSEPVQRPHSPPALPHSRPYVSVVSLLRATLPHFLLVVPIKASASSHPRLRLPVSLPPTDVWLAFLFRILEVPGSNLGRQTLPFLSFAIHSSLIILLCNVIYITVT